ncbi:hypothetical protein KOW79_017902 [Hemibagrus wyckioides]|uniref:Uncharacterized protein n=1 Tax=Hemibagrus wyckioides TaxID=337641 RepID=A0A9D3N9K1_9TELE|nr:hypothetical protein KOW79_017902 [Hemibagrus wyckioides]
MISCSLKDVVLLWRKKKLVYGDHTEPDLALLEELSSGRGCGEERVSQIPSGCVYPPLKADYGFKAASVYPEHRESPDFNEEDQVKVGHTRNHNKVSSGAAALCT